MRKTIGLLVLLMTLLGNMFVFANEYSEPQPLKETVLEYPFKSAKQNEVKYIDGTDSIIDNISSIYDKSQSVARNFDINEIFNILKKVFENIKNFFSGFLKFNKMFLQIFLKIKL